MIDFTFAKRVSLVSMEIHIRTLSQKMVKQGSYLLPQHQGQVFQTLSAPTLYETAVL